MKETRYEQQHLLLAWTPQPHIRPRLIYIYIYKFPPYRLADWSPSHSIKEMSVHTQGMESLY